MKLTNKIGVFADSFRVGIREGLRKAKEVGADGVQFYADGEMDPDRLDASARKAFRKEIEQLGLEISAICGDLGGHGFQDKNENPAKIEKSKRILDLALDLGTNIVTTHIGIIPDDPADPIYQEMLRACEELSNYASSKGAYFAIETGPETAAVLKSFLDRLSNNGVAVNFDPANMVMVTGDDPVEGIKLLKDYVVHTHVKDGVRYAEVDPREVYGALGYQKMSHDKIAQMVTEGKFFEEVPLGKGKVDFDKYFAAIQEIGYQGYLTIEREVGTDPETDIRLAVEFIKRYK